MPATIGPNAQQQAFALSGGYFAYTNASTATLTVSGFDGYCHVEVGNAISKRVVSFNYHLTMSLAVNGPGGLHPTHFPEQASTVYTIYLAWKSATAAVNGTICLFSVPSGTTIDAAKLTALEAGYDYVSRPIGFVINDAAGNVTQFKQEGEWFVFDNPLTALTGGLAVVTTPIPLNAFVPVEATRVYTLLKPHNTNNIGRWCTIAGTIGFFDNAAGLVTYKQSPQLITISNPLATAITYEWTGVAGNVITGASLFVHSVCLPGTDRE